MITVYNIKIYIKIHKLKIVVGVYEAQIQCGGGDMLATDSGSCIVEPEG